MNLPLGQSVDCRMMSDGEPNDRAILDERARSLAEPPAAEPLASEFLELLTFTSDSDRMAIETRFVCEVLKGVELVAMPGQNGPLAGITNLRGEVLAVMSLSPLLKGQKAEKTKENPLRNRWVVVVGYEQAQFGIAVSDVTEVTGISNNDIVDPSRQTRIGESALVRGVTRDARVILNGQAILDDQRLVIEDKD